METHCGLEQGVADELVSKSNQEWGSSIEGVRKERRSNEEGRSTTWGHLGCTWQTQKITREEQGVMVQGEEW